MCHNRWVGVWVQLCVFVVKLCVFVVFVVKNGIMFVSSLNNLTIAHSLSSISIVLKSILLI